MKKDNNMRRTNFHIKGNKNKKKLLTSHIRNMICIKHSYLGKNYLREVNAHIREKYKNILQDRSKCSYQRKDKIEVNGHMRGKANNILQSNKFSNQGGYCQRFMHFDQT